MRYVSLLCVAVLAACASPDERLMMENGIPDRVLERLPEGVEASDVGLEARCYLYDGADGGVVFVTDDAGQRFCVAAN
ncbi:MAG: hypothetical protein AAF672_08710 [Pseudomonadota bacterium]